MKTLRGIGLVIAAIAAGLSILEWSTPTETAFGFLFRVAVDVDVRELQDAVDLRPFIDRLIAMVFQLLELIEPAVDRYLDEEPTLGVFY